MDWMQPPPAPRPYEGHDYRTAAARRRLAWAMVCAVWPVVTVLAAWTGRRLFEVDSGALAGLALAGVAWLLLRRRLRACAACRDPLLLTDWFPRHCHCGARLND